MAKANKFNQGRAVNGSCTKYAQVLAGTDKTS